MSYTDEEILKAKKARQYEDKKQQEQQTLDDEKNESIFDGMVHIFGRETSFSRRIIEPDLISLYMPDEFELMDEDIKKLIFPLATPPKYVFASGETEFQITINPTENIVPDSGIPKFMNITKSLMEKMGPKSRILACAAVQNEDKNIGIMEVVTRAADMNVYNVMFYISINQKLLIGTILCPAKHHERIVPIAKEIIDSIKVEVNTDGNNNIPEY